MVINHGEPFAFKSAGHAKPLNVCFAEMSWRRRSEPHVRRIDYAGFAMAKEPFPVRNVDVPAEVVGLLRPELAHFGDASFPPPSQDGAIGRKGERAGKHETDR